MRQTLRTSILGVAVLTLVSSTAWAQGAGGGRGARHGGGWGKGPGPGRGMMARLDLSAAQLEQVTALRATMEETTSETRDALDERRSEMHDLWMADAPDRAAILAKHAEMDELRRDLRIAKIDFKLAVHALLTPDQRARLDATPDGKRGRRGQRRGGGPGWGAGAGPRNGPCWSEVE